MPGRKTRLQNSDSGAALVLTLILESPETNYREPVDCVRVLLGAIWILTTRTTSPSRDQMLYSVSPDGTPLDSMVKNLGVLKAVEL